MVTSNHPLTGSTEMAATDDRMVAQRWVDGVGKRNILYTRRALQISGISILSNAVGDQRQEWRFFEKIAQADIASFAASRVPSPQI
jgi:hypothetical protein